MRTNLDDGPRSGISQTTGIHVSEQTDVSFLPPAGAPGVLDEPVVGAGIGTVASGQHTVVELFTAAVLHDAARVQLPSGAGIDGDLYIQATVLIGAIVTLFFLSLSSWFTVYSCYQLFNDDRYHYRSGDAANGGSYDYGADCQSTQPLMNGTEQPPPLPDGHPHFSNQPGYPSAGHPQVSYSSQYPSAPPPSGMYPSLNA